MVYAMPEIQDTWVPSPPSARSTEPGGRWPSPCTKTWRGHGHGPLAPRGATHPPEAAAWRQVLPRLSGVLMSKPADSTCSLLSEETMLYN